MTELTEAVGKMGENIKEMTDEIDHMKEMIKKNKSELTKNNRTNLMTILANYGNTLLITLCKSRSIT